MTRSDLLVEFGWESGGVAVTLYDGFLGVFHDDMNEGAGILLTYASALNLASNLLQWATNLPESEKGNIHKIDGEWVDVDDISTE